MRRLTVSVCIAALNEGPDLEATIALLNAGKVAPDSIIVVDDGSELPIGNRLSGWSNVDVIRSDARLGSGPAKSLACCRASGDVLIVMDSHMRPPHDCLDLWLADHHYNPLAVMSCESTGFKTHDAFHGYGADLKLLDKGFWEPKWTPRKPIADPYRVHAVMGGAYLIPRTILKAVGGYAPCLQGYGCEEEFLSIRAWMMGFEVRVAPSVIIPHHYDRPVNRASQNSPGQEQWEIPYNRHVMAKVLFEDGVYERCYQHRIPFPPGVAVRLDANSLAIRALREDLQGRRVRSDSQLAAVCGIRHP